MLPIILDLTGRKALVVGGGRIAYRKAKALADEGAHVTVISPDFVDDFSSMPNSNLVQRTFEPGDTHGYQLVITATGDHAVDQLIYDEGNARGTWVNSADDPDRCAFTLPAALRRGDLMVTVSTGGASPALASWLRSHLELSIVPEFEEVVSRLAVERARIHAEGESTENVQWQPIIAGVMADLGMTCPVVREVETAQ
jgi:precorrin-2 dehydrogenase/sirohydrochlorin ferrochelatase